VLLSHRDLAGASLANIPTGLNAIRATDGLLGIMVAGGLPPKAIAFAMDLLYQFITIDVYEGSLFAQRMERDPQYFERLHGYYAALPRERYPHFVGLLADVMGDGDHESDERFEFGLTCSCAASPATRRARADARSRAARRSGPWRSPP
jgi:hypothetical protein